MPICHPFTIIAPFCMHTIIQLLAHGSFIHPGDATLVIPDPTGIVSLTSGIFTLKQSETNVCMEYRLKHDWTSLRHRESRRWKSRRSNCSYRDSDIAPSCLNTYQRSQTKDSTLFNTRFSPAEKGLMFPYRFRLRLGFCSKQHHNIFELFQKDLRRPSSQCKSSSPYQMKQWLPCNRTKTCVETKLCLQLLGASNAPCWLQNQYQKHLRSSAWSQLKAIQ